MVASATGADLDQLGALFRGQFEHFDALLFHRGNGVVVRGCDHAAEFIGQISTGFQQHSLLIFGQRIEHTDW